MIRFLIIPAAMLFSFCGSPRQSFDPALVSGEVMQMLHEYHDAMATGGLMAEFDYLDSSKQFFWIPPGYNSALDYDSVKAILVQNAPAMESMELEWESLMIFPLSEEAANFHGIVHSVSRDTSGNVFDVRMIESGTIVRRPAGWRLLNGQTSLLLSENY
ncbi:hypothetical protein [Fulvivirga sedimenti]|uniref:Uncharacterized protein n=1 Tax=Fulvivirga sedimenti TaxID=2879465 RepID=A0A9X1HRG5_9BACT|nr:hypothetical protein [Fulvivirga sedimenti]MCA6075638.1 hypothetical protein [Fulvivirga sedimenti]